MFCSVRVLLPQDATNIDLVHFRIVFPICRSRSRVPVDKSASHVIQMFTICRPHALHYLFHMFFPLRSFPQSAPLPIAGTLQAMAVPRHGHGTDITVCGTAMAPQWQYTSRLCDIFWCCILEHARMMGYITPLRHVPACSARKHLHDTTVIRKYAWIQNAGSRIRDPR